MKKIEEKSIKDTPKPKTRHNTNLCSCISYTKYKTYFFKKKLQIKYTETSKVFFLSKC